MIEKLVLWLIKKYFPGFHLHMNPVRKPKTTLEKFVLSMGASKESVEAAQFQHIESERPMYKNQIVDTSQIKKEE